ncbi:hypothetical protein OFL33_33640, partial [Pseudomonas aeruginosa]|nr:hypothetical protein [Pseudomonas aeruginosa]
LPVRMSVEQVSGSAWAECPNGVESAAILGSPSSEASQLRCLSSMTGQLRELMDSGRVRRTDAEALAWLLNGALVDAALRIANAEHPPESLARACQALDVLLDGLLME